MTIFYSDPIPLTPDRLNTGMLIQHPDTGHEWCRITGIVECESDDCAAGQVGDCVAVAILATADGREIYRHLAVTDEPQVRIPAARLVGDQPGIDAVAGAGEGPAAATNPAPAADCLPAAHGDATPTEPGVAGAEPVYPPVAAGSAPTDSLVSVADRGDEVAPAATGATEQGTTLGGEPAGVGQAGSPDDPYAVLVAALTSAARQTRVRGAGTPAATTEPVDFADLIAQVLTSVAANLGGVETLLAGRPGSWEADLVRQLVDGTAGDDGDLVRWRTEPVRLYFGAYDVLFDLGIADLYEQELDEALERMVDGSLTDAQRDAAEDLVDAIEALWEQDQADYTEAYLGMAQHYLTEHGATCGVKLVAEPPDPLGWDGLAEQIDEYARTHTPLPMTGATPDRSEGTPADALRRAGLTYTARVQQHDTSEGGESS